MFLFRSMASVSIFAAAVFLGATPLPVDQGSNTQGMDIDRSIRPGDDFYRYANGTWLKTAAIPAGQTSYDTRAILVEKTSQRVRDIIQEAASSQLVRGSAAQKIGDYYASFMDADSIEAKGLTPLANEMAVISALTNKAALSVYLGTTLNTEVDGLTANADHIFGVWVNQSFTDSDHYVFHLLQGGLGMPDRDIYLDPSLKAVELRAQYKLQIAALLKLAGLADSESRAARILALEIRMAQAHAPDSDAADVFKQNNPWKRADFSVKAPGMDWDAYFKSAGVADQPEFIVWQPVACPKPWLRFYRTHNPRRSAARTPSLPPTPLWVRRSANSTLSVSSRLKLS
jgi:putative endopeptidase